MAKRSKKMSAEQIAARLAAAGIAYVAPAPVSAEERAKHIAEAAVAGMSRYAASQRAGEFDRPVSETRDQRADYAEDVACDYDLAEAIRTGRA